MKKLEQTRDAVYFLAQHQQRLLDVLTAQDSVFTAKDVQHVLQHKQFGLKKDQREKVAALLFADPKNGVIALHGKANKDPVYSTKELLALEQGLKQKVQNLAAAPIAAAPAAAVEKAKALYKSRRDESGKPAGKEHDAAIESALSAGGLKVVVGPPGAGKSTLMQSIADGLETAGMARSNILAVAPTDKATGGFANKLGVAGLTIDDVLSPKGAAAVPKGGILFVDEGGMLGSRKMDKLLDLATQQNAKIIMNGDHRQIPAQDMGDPFRAMLDWVPQSVSKLTAIGRQKSTDDRAAINALRQGDAQTAVESFSMRGMVKWKKGEDDVLKNVAKRFVAYRQEAGNALKSALVVVPDAKTADKANAVIRARMEKEGALGRSVTVQTPKGDSVALAQGDQIMLAGKIVARENGKPLDLPRGTTGIITGQGDGALDVVLDNKKTVQIATNQPLAVKHAYALSVRESQGVSVKRSFVALTDKMNGPEITVALSRHKKQTSLVVDKKKFKDEKALVAAFSEFPKKQMATDFMKKMAILAQGAPGRRAAL